MMIKGILNRVGVIKGLIVGCSDARLDAQELGMVIECHERVEGMEIRDQRSELGWDLTTTHHFCHAPKNYTRWGLKATTLTFTVF